MKVTLFGSTGNLGKECLQQCIEAGHDITVLVRDRKKLPVSAEQRITIVEGDALNFDDVEKAMPLGTDVVLFAIAVDEKTSPQDLCTDITRHILEIMRRNSVSKFVWCGGGGSLLPGDVVTWGAKFVQFFSSTFLKHRHSDKVHQQALLDNNTDLNCIGIRPLQMNHGATTGSYRLGYHAYSGLSKISFGDCAHAMVGMAVDDTWKGRAPIIQY